MKNISITEITDWKDNEGTLNSIKESLKEMGILMVNNPHTLDSDCYGFVLIKKETTKDELFDYFKEILMVEEDIDEEDMEDGSFEDMINRNVDILVEDALDKLKEI